MRKLLQILAFFFPPPINVWLHRFYGARIGRHTNIHIGVLLVVKKLEIGDESKLRFGTFVKCHSFQIGRKCILGYFLIVKGLTDLKTGDACTIGPKTMINCDHPVTLGYYCGIGPGCTLFTHGSFLPVTKGYRTHFGPITLKDMSWVSMNSVVGPGVTVESGSTTMPGTVLIESIKANKIVVGDPAKFRVGPQFLNLKIKNNLESFGNSVLIEYCTWSNHYKGTHFKHDNGLLILGNQNKPKVTVNGNGDIRLLTKSGDQTDGIYFNLSDLSTDRLRTKHKMAIEEFMRLYYGLTFLSGKAD